MSTLKSIADSCFSYLPCDDEDPTKFENIWSSRDERRVGKCFKNFKVMVFESTDDYDSFMKNKLTAQQLELINSKLTTNIEEMMSLRKRSAICLTHFTEVPKKIASNFESKYKKTIPIIEQDFSSNELLPSLSLSDKSDDKANKSMLISLTAHHRLVNKAGANKANQTAELTINLHDILEESSPPKPASKGTSLNSILVLLSVIGVVAVGLAMRR